MRAFLLVNIYLKKKKRFFTMTAWKRSPTAPVSTWTAKTEAFHCENELTVPLPWVSNLWKALTGLYQQKPLFHHTLDVQINPKLNWLNYCLWWKVLKYITTLTIAVGRFFCFENAAHENLSVKTLTRNPNNHFLFTAYALSKTIILRFTFGIYGWKIWNSRLW